MGDPTEDMIKREIAAAAKILREDGHRVGLAAIKAKLDTAFPDAPDGTGDNSGEPKPPERKDQPGNSSAETKKKGLWWGDATDNSTGD